MAKVSQKEALDMAQYIIQILKGNNIWSFFAWGADKFQTINNDKTYGLRFRVNGAVFKGWIRVEYNVGADYFDVTFEKKGKVSEYGQDKEVLTDIDLFQLKDTIDVRVEGDWQHQ